MARGIKTTSIIFLALFILPFALATDTQINVKTWPDYQVSIFVLAPEEVYTLYNSYHKTADSNGMVSVVHTGDQSEFKVSVKLSKDGVNMIYEKFPKISAGETQYYQVIPGSILEDYRTAETNSTTPTQNSTLPTSNETETNETAPIETTQITQTEASTNAITGKVTSFNFGEKLSSFKIKSSYYILLGIILGGVVLFVFRNRIKSAKGLFSSTPVDPVIRSTYNPSSNPNFEATLRNAENRIAEAQAEINRLKNQDKINAAEARLKKDMEDLERMKRGEM